MEIVSREILEEGWWSRWDLGAQEEECEESNEDDWKIDINDGDGNDDIPEETASDDDEEGRPRNRLRICWWAFWGEFGTIYVKGNRKSKWNIIFRNIIASSNKEDRIKKGEILSTNKMIF